MWRVSDWELKIFFGYFCVRDLIFKWLRVEIIFQILFKFSIQHAKDKFSGKFLFHNSFRKQEECFTGRWDLSKPFDLKSFYFISVRWNWEYIQLCISDIPRFGIVPVNLLLFEFFWSRSRRSGEKEEVFMSNLSGICN